MTERTKTWCPQCGPFVADDEDGCCEECGAVCIGDGADTALAVLVDANLRGAVLAELRRIKTGAIKAGNRDH